MAYLSLDLPDLKNFKALKKEESPYIKFFNYIVAKLGTSTKGFDVTTVKINPKDLRILDKYARSWVYKKLYFYADKHKKMEFSMHSLCISPSESPDVPRGVARIDLDWEERIQHES